MFTHFALFMFLSLLALTPLFTHPIAFLAILIFTLSAATSAKILGIAAAVYALLQTAKKIFPSIGGGYALALNVALSILGFLVTVPASSFLTLDTLVGLLMAIAAAAGIHGTVKSLTSPATS